jgi:hypothetical protein
VRGGGGAVLRFCSEAIILQRGDRAEVVIGLTWSREPFK